MPQNVAVFEELTVRENIRLLLRAVCERPREALRDLVDEAIAFVGPGGLREVPPAGNSRRPAASPEHRMRASRTSPSSSSSTSLPWPWTRKAATPSSEGIQNMNRQGSTVVYTRPLHGGSRGDLHAHHDHGPRPGAGHGHERRAQGHDRHGREDQIDVPELDEATLARLDALPHVTRTLYREGTLELACQNGTHNVSDVLAVLQGDGAQFGRIYAETADAERRVPRDHRHRAARLGGGHHVQRIQRRTARAGAREERVHLVAGVSPDPVHDVRVHVREPGRSRGQFEPIPTAVVADENYDAAPGVLGDDRHAGGAGEPTRCSTWRAVMATRQEARDLMSGKRCRRAATSNISGDGAAGYFTVDADGMRHRCT